MVVAQRRPGRGAVPGGRHRGDLAQVVVHEPGRVVVLGHRHGQLGRADHLHAGDLGIGEPAVGGVVGGADRRLHIQPEHHVRRGHRLAVGPLVWLQRDGDVPAAERRVAGQAQRGVQRGLRAVAEPVQRPVHQVLEFLGVVVAAEDAAGEREDVAGRGQRRSAQVAVPPAIGLAEALGVLLLLLLLLLQAASAVRLATARASPPNTLVRNLIVGPPPYPASPFSRRRRFGSVVGHERAALLTNRCSAKAASRACSRLSLVPWV